MEVEWFWHLAREAVLRPAMLRGDCRHHVGGEARGDLLGSSGIGKANFIPYFMWRRFQDNELKHFPVFLHRRDIVLQFENGKEPKGVDVETLWCAPPNALYILDGDVDVEHAVWCQSLGVTSARRPGTSAYKTVSSKLSASKEHCEEAKASKMNCGGSYKIEYNSCEWLIILNIEMNFIYFDLFIFILKFILWIEKW